MYYIVSVCLCNRIVFAHCKKSLRPESGLQNTYIIQSDLYEFGPLLCGKTRDRYWHVVFCAKWTLLSLLSVLTVLFY